MPVVCEKTEAFDNAIAWLRRDERRNTDALAALVMNKPPVPREVFMAYESDAFAGVLISHAFPWGRTAEVTVGDPDTIEPLIECLDTEVRYLFTVRCEHRDVLLAQLHDVTRESERIDYSIEPENLVLIPLPGEARNLTLNDIPLLEAFPQADDDDEPPRARYAQWAHDASDRFRLHGLIVDELLVCYVCWGVQCDPVWEVNIIRTHPDHLRKGYAAALLSYSTAELLADGILPWYNPDNEASRRTCESVGYRPFLCRFSCEGVRAR